MAAETVYSGVLNKKVTFRKPLFLLELECKSKKVVKGGSEPQWTYLDIMRDTQLRLRLMHSIRFAYPNGILAIRQFFKTKHLEITDKGIQYPTDKRMRDVLNLDNMQITNEVTRKINGLVAVRCHIEIDNFLKSWYVFTGQKPLMLASVVKKKMGKCIDEYTASTLRCNPLAITYLIYKVTK